MALPILPTTHRLGHQVLHHIPRRLVRLPMIKSLINMLMQVIIMEEQLDPATEQAAERVHMAEEQVPMVQEQLLIVGQVLMELQEQAHMGQLEQVLMGLQ